MMKNAAIILFAMFLFLTASCTEKKVNKSKQDVATLKSSLEKVNRYFVRSENEDIENYISRHSLDMVNTGTGLRYQILEKGSGDVIQTGQKITMEYELVSITGDLIYSSKESGPKQFIVGEPSVEAGLNEAVLHLHLGDEAIIIIPSHLGYGLVGDQNKILSQYTLIYKVKVTEIE